MSRPVDASRDPSDSTSSPKNPATPAARERTTLWTLHHKSGHPARRPDSPLATAAAELFGLTQQPLPSVDKSSDAPTALPRGGTVCLLAGPSGGGKSTRLRRIRAQAEAADWTVVDVARTRLRPVACVDQFFTRPMTTQAQAETRLKTALQLLARVGLSEAAIFVLPPADLSDGQRWRLRLAVTMWRVAGLCDRSPRLTGKGAPPSRKQGVLLVADEFAAVLDRTTAKLVARALRRTVDRLARLGMPVAAVVATSHDDLVPALQPDTAHWCDA